MFCVPVNLWLLSPEVPNSTLSSCPFSPIQMWRPSFLWLLCWPWSCISCSRLAISDFSNPVVQDPIENCLFPWSSLWLPKLSLPATSYLWTSSPFLTNMTSSWWLLLGLHNPVSQSGQWILFQVPHEAQLRTKGTVNAQCFINALWLISQCRVSTEHENPGKLSGH